MYGEHGLKNEFRDYSNKKYMNNEKLLMTLHITSLFIPLLVPFSWANSNYSMPNLYDHCGMNYFQVFFKDILHLIS